MPTKGQTAHKPLFANALLANTNKVRNIKIKKKQTNQGQKFISKTKFVNEKKINLSTKINSSIKKTNLLIKKQIYQ